MEASELFSSANVAFFRGIALASRLSVRNRVRVLGGLSFQARQALRRSRAAAAGASVPPLLIASVTRSCNLRCVGCYSRALRPDLRSPELSDDRFMAVFEEAVRLGVGTIMLAGGEPFMRPGLLERVSRMKGILVPVFTNGTMLEGAWGKDASWGSLVPVISIEGDEAATDARRGGGIHAGALAAMAELKRNGRLFGVSMTVTSANADQALSDRFASRLDELGIALLVLVEYVPVEPGTEGLVLTQEQRRRLAAFAAKKTRFARIALPGDEEAYGGCLAAGRGFVHISPEGMLEACPFAPFSDTGVAELSLAEALDSPLMRAIRARHGELSETKGGCALWNKAGWVASIGACAPSRIA